MAPTRRLVLHTRRRSCGRGAEMLGGGRGFARGQGRQADVAVMDAERLALPDHVFDSVAFNLCLCTIPDPAAAVRENRRTPDIVKRSGVEVLSIDRWFAGV